MGATAHHPEQETAGREITLIFPSLAARPAAEREEEVKEGAEGNLFPLPLP